MLDAKSLEVLQSLKTEIKANKTILKGKVKGTGRKFGFVVTDKGDEYFLAPDQMAKVFPGDEVTFTVVEQEDGKSRAELESLESSDFKEFKGVYQVRGKAQGVEPFNDAFAGWLFTPPKQSLDAQANDIVVAKVTRHPWQTGKAQSEITAVIGSAANNRTWYSMSLAEYQIPESFSAEELANALELAEQGADFNDFYQDLTDLAFVTIDSETTQDMDDALFACACADGWLLQVAVADASAFVKAGSLLDKAAQQRLTTTYLPGLVLPMLPEILSNQVMSLVANEVRPALVFNLKVNTHGEITEFTPQLATIKSRGKLSYNEVSSWLAENSAPDSYRDNLHQLDLVTQALAKRRTQLAPTMTERVDYRVRVDENFNVSHIDREEKNRARELVEEAMIASNASVAQWLANDSALFMAHKGFKADRDSELKGLLRDYKQDTAELDSHQLPEFIQIIQTAAQLQSFPLLKLLQKRFDRGYWSASAEPHFGLGLTAYTTATSPIRKYSDLLIHRLIKAKLQNEKFSISEQQVEDINQRNSNARFVANAIDKRLKLQWFKQQPTQNWTATIVHINANGLVVQIPENGVSGLVDLRKRKDEYSYDPLRMLIKFDEHQFQLDQQVQVQVAKLDDDNLVFALVE